jgi:hypothetical protein
MAAEAKRQPRLLRRWLLKLRESWRQAGAVSDRLGAARRTNDANADRHGAGRSGDPGPFIGGF